MILYPLIRYFIPFHVYELDSRGIRINGGDVLQWKDMQQVVSLIAMKKKKNIHITK